MISDGPPWSRATTGRPEAIALEHDEAEGLRHRRVHEHVGARVCARERGPAEDAGEGDGVRREPGEERVDGADDAGRGVPADDVQVEGEVCLVEGVCDGGEEVESFLGGEAADAYEDEFAFGPCELGFECGVRARGVEEVGVDAALEELELVFLHVCVEEVVFDECAGVEYRLHGRVGE